MKNYTYLAPEYYKDFACKADKCRHACCSMWRIPVSHEEYNKLITMECSDELNRRIQSTFVIPESVSEDRYRYISFNWLGYCPLQEKKLCNLYLEKGEDYLPLVCRLFPRSLKCINDVNIACCSCSCERVVEMLYECDELNLQEININEKPQVDYLISEQDVKQIKLFNELLKDRSTTLSQSLTEICRIINEKEFDIDFNSDIDGVASGIKLLERLGQENERLSDICSGMKERYLGKKDQFLSDRDLFETRYPKWMNFIERLINNSMIYECFPFVDPRVDKTRVYKGLCFCYGLLRLICIYTGLKSSLKEELIDAVSLLFHLIDHTNFYYNVSVIAENAAVMLKI